MFKKAKSRFAKSAASNLPEKEDFRNEQTTAFSDALESYLVEEIDRKLPELHAEPGLLRLSKLVEQLRLRHAMLSNQNEVQTVSEGKIELDRRKQMKQIAKVFDESVGGRTRALVADGEKGASATQSVISAVKEVVEASGEIGTTIIQVVDKADESERSVQKAYEFAESAIKATELIQVEARKAVELVGLIESIAFQTHILSLNAAVEAARVGEAGRGFAVVATEVKTLSASTSDAAKQVRESVVGMDKAVDAISAKVASILSASAEVSQTIEHMAEAVTTQQKSTERIQTAAVDVRSQTDSFETGIRSIQKQANGLYDEAMGFVEFVSAEPGVSEKEIFFGQSAPFEGAAKSLGTGIRAGIELAFKESEMEGGVHGRCPVLVAKDDKYDPETALTNVRDFVRSGEVFGLVGAVGTPTSRLGERIARGGEVPFVGPVTGAGILRKKDSRHVINVRASYADEAEALVNYAKGRGKLGNTALFYQADAYGLAVRDALTKPLEAKGAKLNVLAPYDRSTGDYTAALALVEEAKPETIFMAGTPKTTAEFVKALRATGLDADLLTISFVDADALSTLVGPAGAGIVISQVVPLPGDKSSSLIKTITQLNAEHRVAAKVGFSVVEGYLIGRCVCETLKIVGPKVTREAFLSALRSRPVRLQIADFLLEFGPSRNSGSNRVYLSQITSEGAFVDPSSRRGSVARSA